MMYAIRNTDTGELMNQVIGKRGRPKTTVYCRFEDKKEARKWLIHWLEMLGEQLGGLSHEDAELFYVTEVDSTFALLSKMGFDLVEWDTCPENK